MNIKNKLSKILKLLLPKYQKLILDYKVDLKPRYINTPHLGLQKIIENSVENYKIYLLKTYKYFENFANINDNKNNSLPFFNNGYLPAIDMLLLYTFIVETKPNLYVEIGSGTSTKIAYKAIAENNLSTKIISIDPNPRSEIDALAHQIIREPFEKINYDFILNLNKNDILFIDNSHRILPNSDAMVVFMEIIPHLKKGVIIHFHDIYLPFDYPQNMCDRFYSEQYALAIMLLANPKKYKILMPNYYISQNKDLSSTIKDFWNMDNTKNLEKHGGSFWIQIAE